MQFTENDLARMSIEELKELCKKLQMELSTVEWFLRQKQMSKAIPKSEK